MVLEWSWVVLGEAKSCFGTKHRKLFKNIKPLQTKHTQQRFCSLAGPGAGELAPGSGAGLDWEKNEKKTI